MLREECRAVLIRWRFCLILCTLILGCLLAGQAPGATGKLTKAENYVRQQAARGEWADLKKRFGEKEKDRTLSARFLEDLLTGACKVDHKGVMIKNAVIVGSLDLQRARIPHGVELINCRFQQKVVFRNAVFDKNLTMNGSRFDQGADFNGVRVALDAQFNKAVFQGPVDFIGADIGRQFSAKEARFESPEHPAIFNGLKVGQHAFFDYATFQGPVDFGSADIGWQFNASEARFESSEQEVAFVYLKVGQSAFFDNATFQGPVDFGGADIRVRFSATGARFESSGQKANFNGLKAQDAFFANTVFKGPVDFVSADIGGQFSADRARFESPKLPANFNGMKVGQSAFFRDVTCRSKIDLTYGSFLDLYLRGAKEEKEDKAGSPVTLQLTGTQVHRELSVTDLKLNSLEAGNLRVKGPAIFERLNIEYKADFQNAALETLKFDKITGPEQGENLKLDGLTYNSLCVDGPDNFAGALGLVKRAAFNPQNYVQLEEFCKRRGHQDWADTVLIALKDRELDPPTACYIRWLKKIFWGWPAGYGRKLLRLLAISLAIILVGAALFNPKYLEGDKNPLKSSLPWDPEYKLEDQKPNRSGRLRQVLLRFLISLDQFLPAVNLGLANHWKTRDRHFLVWLFFTVEQGFGWICVSIGLAALYTQIK